MKVNFKKLVPHAVTPFYAKPGDAGMDLTAVDIKCTDDYIQYSTGLAVAIPVGYVGLLFPRSSISKYALSLANSVGVVDAGYRGEILCRFKDLDKHNIDCPIYGIGDKVAQLIIIPHPFIELNEVADLDETERGEGGFGHTDLNK